MTDGAWTWTPQAVAAWWGAIVSTLMAARALFGARPVVTLGPDPDPQWVMGSDRVRLNIHNLGPTPLLLVRVRELAVKTDRLVIEGEGGIRDIIADAVSGRSCVTLWVPAGETKHLTVDAIPSDAFRVLALRWSRQRIDLFPWSIVVVRGKWVRSLYGCN